MPRPAADCESLGRVLAENQRLRQDNDKLRKINDVLMARVERSMDLHGNDYGLFERAILLETKVNERTDALERALSDLRRINVDLARAKFEAERANSGKTQFLAAASHDLLQPLNAARLFVAALAETRQSAPNRALIDNIDAAFASVEALLNALLEISKLDAGVLQADARDLPLGPLLKRLVAEWRPVAAAKGLELRAVRTSTVVRTDPELLARVVRNLLSNAVRYSERGRVVIGVRRGPGGVRVDVLDQGVGIPADKQQEIFEEFRRLPGAGAAQQEGFGLGLAIVQRIVRILGHSLELASEPGRGSRFSIHLPPGRLQHAAQPPPPSRDKPFKRPQAARGLALVIENDARIREGMEALLGGWGFEARSFAGAAFALQELEDEGERPDFVVADYHLDHGELGTEAIERLRRRFGRDLPALLITADPNAACQHDLARLGLTVLRKPVKPAQLRATILHLTGGKPAV